MVAPMKYAERLALHSPLVAEDHDLLVDMYRGFTPSGTFVDTNDYIVGVNGANYYANNAYQTLYGGASDAGGVDGGDFDAVFQAVLDAVLAGDSKHKIHLKGGVYPFDGFHLSNSEAISEGEQQWIEIEGEGMYNTLLDGNITSAGVASSDGGFTDKAWVMIDSFNDTGLRFYLHDFSIHGHHDDQANIVSGIIAKKPSDSLFERILIEGCSRAGINLVGPNLAYKSTAIINCQIHDLNDPNHVPGNRLTNCSAINCSNGFADAYIWHNVIGDIGTDNALGKPRPWAGNGISLGDSDIAHGNVIYACACGIQTYPGAGSQIIQDNFIDFTDTAGIFIDQSFHVNASNNTLRINYGSGIFLADALTNHVHGNFFEHPVGFDAPVTLISETGTSDYNSIHDNYCITDVAPSYHPIIACGAHSEVKNNLGENPFGVYAIPFKAAETSIGYQGDTATVAASTDYTVRYMDAMIYSTNSGNNNCAIYIKTPAGATINFAPYSTLEGIFVPRGHKVNWGAFTGAVPTVRAVFI